MSILRVQKIRHTASNTDVIDIANDGTCTANITNKPNRNLIINGAMNVAQRGTSSASSDYQTVDRFQHSGSGWDEALTQEQGTVASGTTPYTLGFRKTFKITNGNQTSGFGVNDQVRIDTKLEAQDLATSGWNFKSSSSYITLSYWVKSSVAQEFFGYLYIDDTPYKYGWSLGSLSADTWTKVTVTIPGNSNLGINNDTGVGCWLNLLGIWGSNKTASDATPNTWVAFDGAKRSTDQAATWYTTNNATFEITGVQLEVSDHATDFEHRSYAQELALCQRYFYMHVAGGNVNGNDEDKAICTAVRWNNTEFYGTIFFPVYMRSKPSIYSSLGTDRMLFYKVGSTDGVDAIGIQVMGYNNGVFSFTGGVSSSAPCGWMQLNNNDAYIGFNAEL